MFAYGVSICLRATYIALAPCANEGLYSATALEIIPKSSCSPIENPIIKNPFRYAKQNHHMIGKKRKCGRSNHAGFEAA